ncbi:MAG: S8 family serine peptidase [Bacteroidia bacterium]
MKKLVYFLLPFLFSPLAYITAQNHGDTLRQEMRLDQVYQQYNLSGQGVIVAFIERGIDYTHPDYIDDNGKTRIAYIYDMIDQTGASAPGNPYGIGTIYNRTQIDQALANNSPLGSTDRHGHGTACTSIACGDGSGMPGAPFRGVAPKATIIAVKVTHDAFPARGNVPAQAGFYDPTYLPVALDFVKDKSEELGLPSVSLINLGSIGGPTDGTSTIARAMANFADTGRILVCSAGDDGGADNRAMGQLDTVGTTDIRFKKVTLAGANLRIDHWYHYQDHFEVTIITPNGTSYGPFMHTGGNFDRNNFGGASQGFFGYFNGKDVDFDGAANDQKQMMIDFRGDSGTYTLRFRSLGTHFPFYTSVNPSRYSIQNRFLDFVAQNRSICDFAAAENIIVPNSYVLKNTWTDINGISRARNGEGDPGELWVGSSAGPTRDGRLGIDFSVPGEVNVGAYSPDTYYGTFPFCKLKTATDCMAFKTR